MSDIRTQIVELIRKLGPSSPAAVHDKIGGSYEAVKYQLQQLAAAGTLQATGATISRRYALPGQKPADADAPPQRRKAKKKGKPAQRARPATAPAPVTEPCIAAVTGAPRRLVVIGAGAAPQVYTREQTLAIADTVLDHFEA